MDKHVTIQIYILYIFIKISYINKSKVFQKLKTTWNTFLYIFINTLLLIECSA